MPRATYRWPYGLKIQSKPNQGPNDKSAVGQFMLQRRVILNRVSQPKNLAITFNFAAQSLRPVEGLTSLG
jgi:hypothetical protein